MRNYGVLKGKALAFMRDDDDDPHSELLIDVGGTKFRIAINVRSSRGPVAKRLVEYVIKHDLDHPVLSNARALPDGWNELTGAAARDVGVDYIRSNMFRASEMKPLAHMVSGPDNDLFEFIEALLERAIGDDSAMVYAFGERWGPEEGKEDRYFEFEPGNGVHLIHMNQGDGGGAPYRDGALIIDFPGADTAAGLFIKFQNQIWHTDEVTGAPLPDAPRVPVVPIPDSGDTVAPWQVIAADSPYHLARIVAAMVNPAGADQGREAVTILNISDRTLDLTGWSILDKRDKLETIASGTLAPGAAMVVALSGNGAQLSNDGGTITLLDSQGLKVDGVAYTGTAAKVQGRPVVFI